WLPTVLGSPLHVRSTTQVQGTPCPRDEGLQRVRQVPLRAVPPDRLRERECAHRATTRERQPGDQATQASARDQKAAAGIVLYLEGAEERYPHKAIVAGPRRFSCEAQGRPGPRRHP